MLFSDLAEVDRVEISERCYRAGRQTIPLEREWRSNDYYDRPSRKSSRTIYILCALALMGLTVAFVIVASL